MKSDSKILFTDLDGTLLDDKKDITAENREAIFNALHKGHSIVITTGRPLAAALPMIRDLQLDQDGCYAITYNGGLLYNCYKKIPVYKETIPLSYVRYIFKQAEAFHLHCQTYSDTHVLSNIYNQELEYYVKEIHIPYCIKPGFLDTLTEEPVKVMTIDLTSTDNLCRYRTFMADWAKDKISIFFSGKGYLEHVMKDVSKGRAMKILCRHLNIPLENAIAVGDAENDISMLQTAAIGIAMVNADSKVKKHADFVTKSDNNHSGVAEIIKKFLE